ncbi:MAG: PKD domain-containing protein [Salinivirgaceae bacterium]
MKKLILLTFFAFQLTAWLSAQMIADFETAGTTPELSAEGTFGVVDNPDASGSNPSAKVGYYKKLAGNWHYVTMNFPNGINIGYNNTLTFKLRCSAQGRIFAKFWNGSQVPIEDWAPEWAFQPPANTWVECKMDLTPAMQQQFTSLQLAACVDNEGEGEADVWFDDVQLSNPELGDGSPKVLFTVSDTKVNIGEQISMDASESYDYDGQITDYHWDFGDGSTDSGVTAIHTYLQDSIYTLKLTLTDNDGKKSSASTTLFVMDPEQKLSKLTFATQQPEVNKKIEGIFQINANYTNVYNPDEVKADAEITCPDGKKIIIPCFYYMKARLENTAWIADSSFQAWMFRFNTQQVGTHSVIVKVTDESGTVSSDIAEIEVAQGNNKGFIHNDASNYQYYRHTTGESFYPMGINIGWNNMPNYIQTIQNLSESKANTFRYWHTPFAQQALEWKKTTFYDGLGYYSQKAAAMTDSLLNLGEATNVYMQLAIFQHGMFSENVNPMWADNPYNIANGGYVTRAEEYFYNADCKKQTKKLLRYIVARWGYSKNLFAWEFFNEVQFTGIHNSQTAQWWPGVMTWHSEMSQYVASIDPFNHIQTTSADNNQLLQLDTIKELDVLQYHLYSDKMLDDQVNLDFDFQNKLNNTSIINGEYGTNVEADVPIDMQRNAIWNGIMTQVPHYMWIWEHYLDLSWAGLFTMPMDYLAEEDFGAETTLESYPVTINHSTKTFKTLGLSSGKSFYGYSYDPNFSNNITGAVCELKNIPFANYTISYYLPVSGEVIKTVNVALIQLTNQLQLPEFSKGIAFKIKF